MGEAIWRLSGDRCWLAISKRRVEGFRIDRRKLGISERARKSEWESEEKSELHSCGKAGTGKHYCPKFGYTIIVTLDPIVALLHHFQGIHCFCDSCRRKFFPIIAYYIWSHRYWLWRQLWALCSVVMSISSPSVQHRQAVHSLVGTTP